MGNGISSKSIQALGLGLALSAMAGAPALAKQKIQKTPDHVNGEFIVKLRDSDSKTAQASVFTGLLKALGSGSVLSVNSFQTDKSMHVVKLAKDSDLDAAMARLKAEPAVQYVEPNYVIRAFDDGAPNDADFSKLWGMSNNGQADSSGQVGKAGSDINVLPLWKKGIVGSRNVLVAVIDTGIDWNHPDLKENIYTNPGEIDGDGIDNDGNGFIDDVHGWNFAGKNNNSKDDHGHGSHCSGTIGGMGNNGVGVAGVNWEVTLLPVKFLDASGSGSLQGAIESINYARMMKANIMSNSWGGGGFSQTLMDAIVATRDAGIIFVAAAGNESNNNDASPTYPATYEVENIISVAATDNKDGIASFSNYGTRSVHVAAPGVRVFSTVKDGGYDTYSGTSMATPHVSGIAALLLSVNPTWTFSEIKARLIATSDPVAALRKKVMAKGRVNTFNALNNVVPPSNEPPADAWVTVDQVIESEHPYKKNSNQVFEVKQPGAKFLRVFFEEVDVESRYDHVLIESNGIADDITGKFSNYTSEYVVGDSLKIRLKSDSSVEGFGFKVTKIQYIP